MFDDVASQTTQHLTLEITKGWECDYDFLDEEFMDIIHEAYIDHLVPKVYNFASTADGLEWEKVYLDYVQAIITRVQEWVADRDQDAVGPYLERYRLVKPRLQYLLRKKASHQMPFLRGLQNTMPFFCPRQYIDMSVELGGLEEIGIHVSTCILLRELRVTKDDTIFV